MLGPPVIHRRDTPALQTFLQPLFSRSHTLRPPETATKNRPPKNGSARQGFGFLISVDLNVKVSGKVSEPGSSTCPL